MHFAIPEVRLRTGNLQVDTRWDSQDRHGRWWYYTSGFSARSEWQDAANLTGALATALDAENKVHANLLLNEYVHTGGTWACQPPNCERDLSGFALRDKEERPPSPTTIVYRTGSSLLRWSVCHHYVPGTPCGSPDPAACDAAHYKTGWPDAERGPWYCAKVHNACCQMQTIAYTQREDCYVAGTVSDCSSCGACGKLKMPNWDGLWMETPQPPIPDFDLGEAVPLRAAVPPGREPWRTSCEGETKKKVKILFPDGKTEVRAFSDHSSSEESYYVERYVSTCIDIHGNPGCRNDRSTDYMWVMMYEEDYESDCPE